MSSPLPKTLLAVLIGASTLALPAYLAYDGSALEADVLSSSSASSVQTIQAQQCGNGDIEAYEQCDDGDITDADGCTACAVDPGYTCIGEPSLCGLILATCGNGQADPNETCDDKNPNNGDGCSILCTIEEGFTCDGLPSVCQQTSSSSTTSVSSSSDAIASSSSSSAPSPVILSSKASTQAVTTSSVYRVRPRDDIPSFTDTRDPNAFKTTPDLRCGDGLVVREECDDANTANGDGCSATCVIEPGFSCRAVQPSICNRQ